LRQSSATAPSFSFPELSTERLLMRGFGESDFDALVAMYAEPDFARFITFNGQPYGVGMAWRTICTMTGHWVLRGYGMWAVEEKSSRTLVGFVGPHFPADWPAQEIGWAIAKTHWGKGYATEAARAAMAYAAQTLKWRHVIHVINPENVRSAAVALKLGSKPEGTWQREGKELTLYGQDLPAS
jgi:RimJ/RimL family protein N-acetyltransferase